MNYYIENEHTKKEVVFNQTAGLGDVLFIEPIYRHYFDKGYKVIAPVNDDIIWIQEYIPYVEFYKKSQFKYSYETVEQPNDGRLHLPTRFSHPLLRSYDLHYGDQRQFWMPDKYEYLGLPVDLWRTLKFERNKEREQALFDLVVGNKDDPYDFINPYFGGSFEKVNISKINVIKAELKRNESGDLIMDSHLDMSLWRNIEMQKIEGFTMLDWGMVIEEAETIHTVETSLLYYVESLKFSGEKHLYPRYPFMDNCEYMNTILTDWIFHDKNDLI